MKTTKTCEIKKSTITFFVIAFIILFAVLVMSFSKNLDSSNESMLPQSSYKMSNINSYVEAHRLNVDGVTYIVIVGRSGAAVSIIKHR